MELLTRGKRFYPDYKMPLFYNRDNDFMGTESISDRFKIILITNGSGVFSFENKRFILSAPTIICLNEREKLELVIGDKMEVKTLYFHPEIINSTFTFENILKPYNFSLTEKQDLFTLHPFIARDMNSLVLIKLTEPIYNRFQDFFDTISLELTEKYDGFWPCRTRSVFIELLFLIRKIMNNKSALDEKMLTFGDNMDSLILYLNTNYNKKITIKELTRQFCTNRTTLASKFKAAFGESVISYLNKIRIQVASQLLRDTELGIQQIMYRVGFNDITHFGRVFKKLKGYSPSSYRHKYCWMINHN